MRRWRNQLALQHLSAWLGLRRLRTENADHYVNSTDGDGVVRAGVDSLPLKATISRRCSNQRDRRWGAATPSPRWRRSDSSPPMKSDSSGRFPRLSRSHAVQLVIAGSVQPTRPGATRFEAPAEPTSAHSLPRFYDRVYHFDSKVSSVFDTMTR